MSSRYSGGWYSTGRNKVDHYFGADDSTSWCGRATSHSEHRDEHPLYRPCSHCVTARLKDIES